MSSVWVCCEISVCTITVYILIANFITEWPGYVGRRESAFRGEGDGTDTAVRESTGNVWTLCITIRWQSDAVFSYHRPLQWWQLLPMTIMQIWVSDISPSIHYSLSLSHPLSLSLPQTCTHTHTHTHTLTHRWNHFNSSRGSSESAARCSGWTRKAPANYCRIWAAGACNDIPMLHEFQFIMISVWLPQFCDSWPTKKARNCRNNGWPSWSHRR